MELESYNYVVTITREHRDSKFDAPMYLYLKVNNERLASGYYYTLNGARKKALKAIKLHQKDVAKGTKFGIVFGANGDYEQIVEDLKN